jgi:transposase
MWRKAALRSPAADDPDARSIEVIVNKGADHLPLHRQEGIFKRQGLRISRQTLDGWWLQTAEFLRPLYDVAVRVVLASG